MIPETGAIEKQLWNFINKEREPLNLSLLELSSVLSEAARGPQGKHPRSRFCADRDRSHSLGSRGYYVTQDFIRPLLPMSNKQVCRIVLERIDGQRRSAHLPPLELWREAGQLVQDLAERKAKGLSLPAISSEFGETLAVFLSTPELNEEEILFADAIDSRYRRGALGIWFGKNGDYPGGVYVLALLLFAENRRASLSLTYGMEDLSLLPASLYGLVRKSSLKNRHRSGPSKDEKLSERNVYGHSFV